ncbi:MAG: PEP-CTERM sorting domain-containing protein [Nitrospirae bacterium]|nr:PEP-CTERM sorting domain-containing protein [Nitrospirota bacterium]
MRKKLTTLVLVTLTAIITAFSGNALATSIAEIEGNDSFASAQSIDAFFSINSNPNVFGTLPTVSIHGSNGAATDVDYYRFTVANTGIGYFDIDDVTKSGSLWIGNSLSLYDSGHNLLAADFDTLNYDEDPGSVSTFDSFLGVYNFTNAGVYFIAVSTEYTSPGTPGTLGGNLGRPDCVMPACNPNNPPVDFRNGGKYYLGDSGPTSVNTTGASDAFGNYTLHVTIANPVPEPSTALLFGLGMITLLIISRLYFLSPLFNKSDIRK